MSIGFGTKDGIANIAVSHRPLRQGIDIKRLSAARLNETKINGGRHLQFNLQELMPDVRELTVIGIAAVAG